MTTETTNVLDEFEDDVESVCEEVLDLRKRLEEKNEDEVDMDDVKLDVEKIEDAIETIEDTFSDLKDNVEELKRDLSE